MATILLIEDDDAVRHATRLVLEGAGHQVHEAPSGMRVEGMVTERKPDLVITDMLMPERDGVETILTLRRRHPALRIIAVSGGGTRGQLDLGMAEKLGVSATLPKPFEAQKLLAIIDEVLAGPAPGAR